MDDSYLREFVDLAGTCNFQESAANTYISTATLSKHIRKLEEALGVPLFDRSTRSVTLSKYGSVFLGYATRIVELTDGYLQELDHLRTLDENQLNIGFLPMLGRFGILEFLSDFTAANPGIALNVSEGNQLEELLLNHKYDFVFVDAYGPQDPKIEKLVFKTDHLVAIFPKDHPLSQSASITISELRDEDFILQCTSTGKPTKTAQNFLNCCRENGFEAQVALTTRYITTIARMVEKEKGVGILYSSEIQDELNFSHSIVDIDPVIPFDICVSFLPSRIRNEGAEQFLAQVKLAAARNHARM